nr:GFA family protein [Sphingomonas sp.]
AYLCHCRMCQRATGSVSIAFKSVPAVDVRWETEPDWYDSSPIAHRPFCAQCGTSLGFAFKADSNDLDLTIASFDEPSRFRPKHHFGAESMHRAWLNTEGLPEIRTEEHQKLVGKWMAATGRLPD